MKQKHKKLKVLGCVLSGALLSACNGGNNAAGGQNLTGAPIQANVSQSLFSTSSCLTGKADFSGTSQWYVSGNVSVSNTCSSDQSLSGQTISFTSQDVNGNSVAVGTLNNWWINDTAYQMVFSAGSGNTQVATVNATNNNPVIKANQTIVFTGGLNLTGAAFDNNTAQNSFAINGASPTPTPTPTPTTSPTPSPTTSPSPSPSPSPTPVAVSMDVAVDTTNAGCASGSVCNGLNVKVTDTSGSVVAQFDVPSSSYGGIYTQPITGLVDGSTYKAIGSAISNATVNYTPAESIKVQSGSSNKITVSYTKNAATTGSATISLGNYISAYTGNLDVQLINTKNGNEVVNTYSIKQGGNFSTGELPASDSTHAYQLKMTSGIADPLNGLYYIESGLPAVTINKGQVTTQTIAMKASSVAKNNLTLVISGLDSGDKANVSFSDASGKYQYVNAANQVNGSVVYKVESGLNFGVSVRASGAGYATNPINNTKVVNSATTIDAAFAAKPVSTATYDYIAPFKDYNNKIVLSINGLASSKSLTFTSNFQQKAGWGTCFGLSADNINFTSTKSGTKYLNTIAAKDKTNWDGSISAQSLDLTKSCDVMGTDNGADVLPGVIDPIVYNVTVNGSSLSMAQPCTATNCKDPGNGYVNAGYYAQWSVWGRQYNPYNMPFNNINDIIYAFVGFNPATGDVKTLDASADSWGMSAVSRAMLQYPYMNAHLSFGGWTNNGINTAPMFEQLASSTTSMNNFATQAIALMRKTGFTGIDIDWEWWSDYANNVAPAKKMLAFYQILRTALDNAGKEDGKTYTLSIAVNGGSDRILALEGKNVDGTSNGNPNAVSNFWAQVGSLMNHINVMNYDYHGSWDAGNPAYFQANYAFQNTGSNKVGKDEGWSIKSSMDTYISRGVPAKKLVAGIPLYARTMTVASSTNGGLFQSVTGAGFGDYENGILDYKCIVNPVNNPATGCGSDKPIAGVKSLAYYSSTSNVETFNQYGLEAMQPWAYSAVTNTFMTYDDQYSAVQKAKAVKSTGLGGTMYWELDGDAQNPQQSIVQAVKDELNR